MSIAGWCGPGLVVGDFEWDAWIRKYESGLVDVETLRAAFDVTHEVVSRPVLPSWGRWFLGDSLTAYGGIAGGTIRKP